MLTLDPRLRLLSRAPLALALSLAVFPSVVAAQETGEKEPVETTAEMAAAQDIALARQLVLFGQRTGTPEPYVAAARIMIETPISDPTFESTSSVIQEGAGPAEAAEKSPVPRLRVTDLLATARELAGDDENMLAVIDELEGSMTKGRVGGAAIHYDRVEAYSTDIYRISFRGGETAIIEVVGDGDTDLDCYVYDANGNLIVSDADYTDHCVLIWTPAWTGSFELQIQNLGSVWNGYVLSTN
ncbi:MAG: hypothetical protein JSV86_03825 [Gemmatimonadota bacterium]|nr:MAG: hypothetical protein JSV86_03825 [Gemmatimonadota bacterium]